MTLPRLPAEWEPQSGIMLTWPHSHTDWADILAEVEPTFAQIAAHTSLHEKVLIVANNDAHRSHIIDCITAYSPSTENIVFALCDSNDSWARDHGPISVIDESGQLLLLDFQFNAWGGKYASDLDNKISESLAKQHCFSAPVKTIDFILEGGSIESDGQGTLLTTRCLLSSKRNTGWSQQQIEAELNKRFGLKQIHWLHEGNIEGDDTDAHIDTLARFISGHQIMHVLCTDKKDPHYQPLMAMQHELESLQTIDGKPYELIPLPLPEPVFNEDGERLPATYANFLIINGAVLVPVYNQTADKDVLEIFETHFTDREIIGINCLPLIKQFGSLHCVTMQFPAGVLVG